MRLDLDPTTAILFQIPNRALKIKGDFFFFPNSVTTLDKITLEIRLLILLLVWVII